MAIPVPLGGLARPIDFAPSVFFAVVHGTLLVSGIIYRCRSRTKFTALIMGAGAYLIERTIWLSLRASVARKPGSESEGLSDYLQIALAMGTGQALGDTLKLLRCVLVNSTFSAESHYRTLEVQGTEEFELNSIEKNIPALIYEGKKPKPKTSKCELDAAGFTLDTLAVQSTSSLPDQPRRRWWFRRLDDVMVLVWLLYMGFGFWGNAAVTAKGARARRVVRYLSTSIAMVIISVIAIGAGLAQKKLTRINPLATRFLLTICCLFATTAIYRLVVMREMVDDIHSTSFDNRRQKILFYVFHTTPDFLIGCMFMFNDVRGIFASGINGDYVFKDENPEARQKRHQKYREKAQKAKEKAERKQAKKLGQTISSPSLPNIPVD